MPLGKTAAPDGSESAQFFAGRAVEYVDHRGSVAVADTWHPAMAVTAVPDLDLSGIGHLAPTAR